MNLTYHPVPEKNDQQFLEDQLIGFNSEKIQGYGFETFLYKMEDDSGCMVAGIDCDMCGGWLYIISLWVDEKHRGQGIGDRLLAAAERKAKEKGCHGSHLYTYSFQAPEFYEKHGYDKIASLEGFCGDHSKFFMKKHLV